MPVYLDETELTPELGLALSRIQALRRSDDKNYRRRLLEALGQLSKPERPVNEHKDILNKESKDSAVKESSTAKESTQPSTRIVLGEFELDVASGQLSGSNQELRLSPRAVEVLVCLSEHNGEVVSKETLHETVWANRIVTDAQISKAINELRNAFGDLSEPRRYIETLPRRGYRLLCAISLSMGETDKSAQPATDIRAPAANASVQSRSGSFPLFAFIGLVLIVTIGAALGLMVFLKPKDLVRSPLLLDGWEDWKHSTNPTPSMVISPDGNTVVYVARDKGTTSLRMMRLDRPYKIELAGTEGARQPFFSPDGLWVGFIADGLMKRVSLSGDQPPSTITDVKGQTFGASWGPDDRIYYAEGRSALKSVLVSGGDIQEATQLDPGRRGAHRLPHHIPGQRILLLSIFFRSEIRSETWALNLDTGQRHFLVEGLAPAYIDSGHILFTRADAGRHRKRELMGGSLWAVPFDVDSITLTGTPRPIQNAVAGREGSAFAVSRSGTLIYMPKQGETQGQLVLLGSRGSREQVLASGPLFEHPQFSNDGKSIAVAASENGKLPSILVYGVTSGSVTHFADEARFPLWDPDDQGITFWKNGIGLVRQRPGATESVETLKSTKILTIPDAWINNGQTLVFHGSGPDSTGSGVINVSILESGNESRGINVGNDSTFPNFTLGESWIAYCTWPRGVHIESFESFTNNLSGSVITSTATSSGCYPHWGNNDTQLYYQEFNELWSVDVNFSEGIAFGKREKIADLGYPVFSPYDISNSGQIVISRQKDTAPKSPVLMMNWESMLE